MAGALSLTGLVKRFGDEVAVDGLPARRLREQAPGFADSTSMY